MATPERDIYLTGRLVNGLPTCVFPAASYHRTVTNIVVGNSTTSNVRCYRGLLGSTPVAQNPIGADNTLRGRIGLPAGQQFFVQWSATGASVSDAFARISSERDDSPLAGSSTAHEWVVNAVTNLVIPNTAGPNDPRIEIGTNPPADLVAKYAAIPETIIVGLILYRGLAGAYVYLILSYAPAVVRLCIGARDFDTDITEWLALSASTVTGPFTLQFGRLNTTFPTILVHHYLNSTIKMDSSGPFNSDINLTSGSALLVDATSDINMLDGGTLTAFGTGVNDRIILNAATPSVLTVNSAASIGILGDLLVDSNSILDWDTGQTTTWTSSGAATTLGNGSLVLRVMKQRESLLWLLVLTWGNTTSAPVGTWEFTLPYAPFNSNQAISGFAWDNSLSLLYPCIGRARAASPEIHMIGTPTGALVSNALPMVWAQNDILALTNITRINQ